MPRGVVIRVVVRLQVRLSDGVPVPVVDDEVKAAALAVALGLPATAQHAGVALRRHRSLVFLLRRVRSEYPIPSGPCLFIEGLLSVSARDPARTCDISILK